MTSHNRLKPFQKLHCYFPAPAFSQDTSAIYSIGYMAPKLLIGALDEYQRSTYSNETL